MPSKRKTLYLIDGHALAYRTYFALTAAGGEGGSRWVTTSGEPTAGTYGFTSVLLRLLEQDKPDYLAVSFDTGRTFRDDLYADYKGTREKMPDDLAAQIERIREVVQAFSIPRLEAEGYEADDVLGTVARQAAAHGVAVKIITGDRDLLQLADTRVTINLAGRKLAEAEDYTPEKVREKYGLEPKQIVDLKALVGDKSDNIPGVAGVGEKTATELLQRYKTLDGIYKHLDEVPARFRKKLAEGRDLAYLSQQLARIATDVPIEFDLDQCVAGEFDRDRVADLFRVLEFRSLLARLPLRSEAAGSPTSAQEGAGEAAETAAGAPRKRARPPGAGPGQQLAMFGAGHVAVAATASSAQTGAQVHIVSQAADVQQLAARLQSAPAVTFDVETTSTDPMRATLVGVALAVAPGEGYYIPVGHLEAPNGQLPAETVIEALRPALTNPKILKYGHNLKYDYAVLARLGLEVAPLSFDTMLAEWLCDPASRNLGLKNLAWVRLGVEMTAIEALIGKGARQISMDRVPVEPAASYAVADVDMTARLVPILESELKTKNQWQLFVDVEMPLVPVLAEMEMIGVALDTVFLQDLSGKLSRRLGEIERQIYDYAGREFNINSTQQLSDVLYGKLGLSPPGRTRKTAAGRYSTAADVLEDMRGQHPILDLILDQRELTKLKGTYVDALPQAINPETGRVHTSYNQAGAVTGRIASSDPNLQNIPIRSELGRQVRRAFVAGRGRRLVAVDYSQIELRIAAHVSGDETLRRAFLDGDDIHAATAAAVYGVPRQQVTSDQRRTAKAVNFGILYGQSAYGLMRTTGLTLAEAEDFINHYFERFPGVRRYLDETKRLAATQGYVETLLGRRRYFPILQRRASTAQDAILRGRAEREAINAPIQGSAADIIKLAMLRLPAALRRDGLAANMILQVHDELVCECPLAETAQVAARAREIMEGAFRLDVPLKADVRVGTNWYEMEPVA